MDVKPSATRVASENTAASNGLLRTVKRFRDRPYDWVFVFFFLLNVCFITYVVDIEQLTVANPYHFTPPASTPMFFVNMVHHYGATFDPDLMARPAWWKATIWIDAVGFGPFYVFAIYAFIRGRDWIRIPCIMYASVMMTNVTVIMFEEMSGATPTPHPVIVWLLNIPWILLPLGLLVRMIPFATPFTKPVGFNGVAQPVTTITGGPAQ